jgi:kinesin family protein C2/C3
MLERALDGFSMTVFAYGQTGSGKTYSMEGTDEHPGVAIRTMKNLFALGESKTAERSRAYGRDVEPFNFSLSIMEIYQDRVRDLLIGTTAEDLMVTGEYADPVKTIFGSDRDIAAIGVGKLDDKWARNLRAPAPSTFVAGDNLSVRETSAGVEIVGLTRVAVSNARQALEAVRIASSGRSVGSHALNDRSSRSHVIIRVWVEGPGPTHVKGRVLSTINLVDLAGSERVMKTGVEGEGMKEAQAINTSLSALGNVISALRKGSSHIPFRDSKLTFALKDAMTGSSRVMMLCCISADDANISESMCSLTFAQRCRATALGAPERKVIGTEPSESGRSESASRGGKPGQQGGPTRRVTSSKAYQDADDVASITSSLLAEDEPNGDGERHTVSFSNKATPDPTGMKRSPSSNTRKVTTTTTSSTSPFVKARSGSTLRKK